MNFLKKLFSSGQPSDNAYIVYVKPKMCKEIVQVRINLNNDLSPTEDYDGYWVRKVASATRCPFQAEMTLHFDKRKQLQNRSIENGEFATEDDYQAYIEANEATQA